MSHSVSELTFNENLIVVTPTASTGVQVNSKKPTATGTVIWKGVNSIYDIDAVITFYTEDTFTINHNDTVYTCVWQKDVLFAFPVAS